MIVVTENNKQYSEDSLKNKEYNNAPSGIHIDGENFFLHTTVEGFNLLIDQMLLNKNTYGAVDYYLLYEDNVTKFYLSSRGIKQAFDLGKKLLEDSVYKKLISDSKNIKEVLKTYKPKDLNDNSVFTEWEKYVEIFNEFCRIYRFFEQPFLKALEDEITKKISKEKLLELLSKKKKLDDEYVSMLLDKLIEIGEVKLDLHLLAEKLFTEFINLFVEYVSKKYHLKIDYVKDLRLSEFVKALKGEKPNIKDIKSYVESCVLYRNGEMVVLDTNVKFWKNKLIKRSYKIKGNIAYPGIAIGKVKKHLSWTETTSIEEGEILVTGMTNPQMVPFIKNAKAIITDEGGITCHAAIISREFKIPCITGTQNATSILNDGDVVEVDADNGFVRILERAHQKSTHGI